MPQHYSGLTDLLIKNLHQSNLKIQQGSIPTQLLAPDSLRAQALQGLTKVTKLYNYFISSLSVGQ